MHQDVLNDFLSKIALCIVYKSNAYLLYELLKDWLSTWEESELILNITQTQLLKKETIKRFPESTRFYKSGQFVIVYSQYTNTCEYSISTLKDFGLRNEDIMKSFANMIKRNTSQPSDGSLEFLYNPDKLKFLISKGPQQALFKTIFMMLHDLMKLNENGYAITYSRKLATKIWALANDWGLLLSQ